MTDQSFIRRVTGGQPVPATTIRIVNGDHVRVSYDPDDETEQVYRPSPLQQTWEPAP